MTEREALKNIYEIWAGSDGIPVPETAVEAYLLRIIEQMRDEASKALAEVEQEPFGYLDAIQLDRWEIIKGTEYECIESAYIGFSKVPFTSELTNCQLPIYTAPLQQEHKATRKWIGLTNENMSSIFDQFDWKELEIAGEYLDLFTFAKAIEAKLNELNHHD